MCGITGLSFSKKPDVDVSKLVNALLTLIENRGRDATGWAYPQDDRIQVIKAPLRVSDKRWTPGGVPDDVSWVLGHTRHATKGDYQDNINNHPIKHRNLIGTHNGVINNAEALFKNLFTRENEKAEVDSEAIWAAIAERGVDRGLAMLSGWYALAWVDVDRPDTVCLIKDDTTPLYVIELPFGIAWGSAGYGLDSLFKEYKIESKRLVPYTLYVFQNGELVKQRVLRRTKKANRRVTYTGRPYGRTSYGPATALNPWEWEDSDDDFLPCPVCNNYICTCAGDIDWTDPDVLASVKQGGNRNTALGTVSGNRIVCVECRKVYREIDIIPYAGIRWCPSCHGRTRLSMLNDEPVETLTVPVEVQPVLFTKEG